MPKYSDEKTYYDAMMKEKRYYKYKNDAYSKEPCYAEKDQDYNEAEQKKKEVEKAAVNQNIYTDTVSTNAIAPMSGYEVTKSNANNSERNAESVEKDLESKAVSITAIENACDEYDNIIQKYKLIIDKLDEVKSNLGYAGIRISENTFDRAIDEINAYINMCASNAKQFNDAVRKRKQLVHDFQKWYIMDYYKYYGKNNYESKLSSAKFWNRSGW